MYKITIQILLAKKAAITNCIQLLSVINYIDNCPTNTQLTMRAALHMLSGYPNIEKLKRSILKYGEICDNNIVVVEKAIHSYITDNTGYSKKPTLNDINSLLLEALEYLTIQINKA